MQRELRSKALETPSAVARLAMEGDARLNITKDRLEDGEEVSAGARSGAKRGGNQGDQPTPTISNTPHAPQTLPSRPAASLTPADVVLSVLYGLSNPDDPYPNAGIDRLLNFSSPVAAANGLSAAEVRLPPPLPHPPLPHPLPFISPRAVQDLPRHDQVRGALEPQRAGVRPQGRALPGQAARE